MSFLRYLRDDFNDWVETIGPFVASDIAEVHNTNPNPTHPLSSTDSPATELPDRECLEATARIESQHSDSKRVSKSKKPIAEGVTNNKHLDLKPNHDTHLKAQNDDCQQKSPSTQIKKASLKFNTYYLNLNLCSQIHTLQQDVVSLLRWEDRSSMTIREMNEEARTRKSETRAIEKTAVQAKAEMQGQINNYKRQIEQAEQDKIRVSNENARAIQAHERRLQDAKQEVETQKKATEEAAAAAERQSTEAETKHTKELSAANKKIEELRAAQSSTLNSQRDLRKQLSQTEKQKAEELSAKDLEIATLKTSIDARDSEIRRLGAEAESAREARRELIREKNDLAHAIVGAERRADRLETENGRLVSERENVESRAVDAEGRARGLQDQLKAARTKAEQSERLYQEAAENTRDRVLSAYSTPTAQEDQQSTITTTNEEQRLSALVQELRNENSQLREEQGHWDRDWENAVDAVDAYETEMVRWCEAEKQQAVDNERANSQAISGTDASGQTNHRQCEEEEQQALAVERETCRSQNEVRECSLRRRKVNSNTDRKMRRFHRWGGIESRKQMKFKTGQMKWVFNEAVSHAVKHERLLLLGQFQVQFQTEISSYKAQIDSERGHTRTEAEAHNQAIPMDQILLNEEIRKRDDCINSHEKNLKDALAGKRELEATLTLSKAEIDRLSLAVTTYESQTSLTKQTQTEAQVLLMARELSRALKLLAEICAVDLDEKHRVLLNELILANKVVTDIRTTIEDGSAVVDYDAFQGGLDRVMASSDPYEALDPRERPALHAQLTETYRIVGALSNILASERGDTTKWDILERIYSDSIKGKGKQGVMSGSNTASGSSSGGNGGFRAAPLPQATVDNSSTSALSTNLQTGFSDPSTLNSLSDPSNNPSSTETTTNAGESQDEPEWIDSATAHASLDTSAYFDPDSFRFDDFRVENVDFDTPERRNYDPSAPVAATSQTPL